MAWGARNLISTQAERAAAGASGAVGAIAHPDIQQTIADEKESRRTAAVSEFRAQRRAVDAELADLRTTRARAVDSLRKERADRAKTDTAREAALAAAASAASRLTARRVAKAVRETEDRAFSAHALALEDAATAQQQRHRLCGNQPVRRVHISRRRRGHAGSVERRGTGIATPSSRRRVDGVEDDAAIQDEHAVKF
jgi:hypothetical protein